MKTPGERNAQASELPSWPGGVAATSKNGAKHPLKERTGWWFYFKQKIFVGIRTTTPSVPSSVASRYFLDGTATPPGQEGSFARFNVPLLVKTGLLALVLLCCAVPSFAEYRMVEIESLRITVDTDWAVQTTPGYFPIRLDITNLGDNREIRIAGTEQRWFDFRRRSRTTGPSMFGPSSQMGSSNFSQVVRLKRGDRVKLTIPVPIMADSENVSIRIWEGGRPLEGFVSNASFQSGHPAEQAAVLFVADPSSPFGIQAASWSRPMTAPRRGRGAAPFTARFGTAPNVDFLLEPGRLPSNWLGFTSLRAVAVGPTAWEQLTPSQKEAVLTWTASGGDLLLVDGTLDTVLSAENRPVNLRTTNEAFNNYYFGRIHLVKSSDIDEKGMAPTMSGIAIAPPYTDWTLPANRAMDWGWIAGRGFRLPIDGVGGIPTKAYLSMLVLFSVIIGPLNYLYLWRKRQQVLLVLTVPVISLVFIAVLAAYAFLGEGLAVRGRAATFTILDQTTKQAATRASVSLYAGGIAPSGGLTFPSQFAIFPFGSDGVGLRGQTALDLTDSQRFSNGMLQARSPSNFEEIAYGPARERLSIERNGNEFSAINGLGSTVTQLYYREQGHIYALTGTLDAGQKGSLRPGTIKAADIYEDATKYESALNPEKFKLLVDTQPNGTYLAVLEKSPFWDPGVASLEEHSSFHLVLGYVGGLP